MPGFAAGLASGLQSGIQEEALQEQRMVQARSELAREQNYASEAEWRRRQEGKADWLQSRQALNDEYTRVSGQMDAMDSTTPEFQQLAATKSQLTRALHDNFLRSPYAQDGLQNRQDGMEHAHDLSTGAAQIDPENPQPSYEAFAHAIHGDPKRLLTPEAAQAAQDMQQGWDMLQQDGGQRYLRGFNYFKKPYLAGYIGHDLPGGAGVVTDAEFAPGTPAANGAPGEFHPMLKFSYKDRNGNSGVMYMPMFDHGTLTPDQQTFLHTVNVDDLANQSQALIAAHGIANNDPDVRDMIEKGDYSKVEPHVDAVAVANAHPAQLVNPTDPIHGVAVHGAFGSMAPQGLAQQPSAGAPTFPGLMSFEQASADVENARRAGVSRHLVPVINSAQQILGYTTSSKREMPQVLATDPNKPAIDTARLAEIQAGTEAAQRRGFQLAVGRLPGAPADSPTGLYEIDPTDPTRPKPVGLEGATRLGAAQNVVQLTPEQLQAASSYLEATGRPMPGLPRGSGAQVAAYHYQQYLGQGGTPEKYTAHLTDIAARNLFQKDLITGPDSKDLSFVGAAVPHLLEMGRIYKALNNNDIILANRLGNTLGLQFGSDAAANAKLMNVFASGEIGKYLKESTVSGLDKIQEAMSPNLSPSQGESNINLAITAMMDKMEAMRAKGKAVHNPKAFADYLPDTLRKVYGTYLKHKGVDIGELEQPQGLEVGPQAVPPQSGPASQGLAPAPVQNNGQGVTAVDPTDPSGLGTPAFSPPVAAGVGGHVPPIVPAPASAVSPPMPAPTSRRDAARGKGGFQEGHVYPGSAAGSYVALVGGVWHPAKEVNGKWQIQP